MPNFVFPSFRDPLWIFAILIGPLFWLIIPQTGLIDKSTDLDWLKYLLALLVYPVLEEIVFRGWIQSELVAKETFRVKYFFITFANWITSALFSLFHLINHEPVWALLVFFPSILFGLLRDKYQAITPPIILHIYFNAGFVFFVAT